MFLELVTLVCVSFWASGGKAAILSDLSDATL